MRPLLTLIMLITALATTGCIKQTGTGTSWDEIDFASIHCAGASGDNTTCHPKDDDPAVIGARSGKSK